MSERECDDRRDTGEKGFVLITVMMVMILLLGLAMAVVDGTVLETNIARNNREYTMTFHKADGVAMETVQLMENDKNPLNLDPLYMENGSPFEFIQNIKTEYKDYTLFSQYSKPSGWNDLTLNPAFLHNSQLLNDVPSSIVRSTAVLRDSKDGSNRNGSGEGTRLYEYTVYGQATAGETPVIIAVGYRVRM